MNTLKEERPNVIVCPYCDYIHVDGHEHVESGSYEGDFGMECEKCQGRFIVTFQSVFLFKT